MGVILVIYQIESSQFSANRRELSGLSPAVNGPLGIMGRVACDASGDPLNQGVDRSNTTHYSHVAVLTPNNPTDELAGATSVVRLDRDSMQLPAEAQARSCASPAGAPLSTALARATSHLPPAIPVSARAVAMASMQKSLQQQLVDS